VLLGPLVGDIAIAFGLASESEVGNISAMFLLVGGLLAFFWVGLDNFLSRYIKSSRKVLIIIASLIWSSGLFLTSIANNYTELFWYQMFTAVGYAANIPLAYSIAMDFTPPEQRAKTFGFLDVAAMVGVGIGFLLSGTLSGVVPWGVPFIIIGTFGLILTSFLIGIQEPKRGIHDNELRGALTQGATYDFYLNRKSLSLMLQKKSNILILFFNLILYLASGSISYYFIRMMGKDHGFPSILAVFFFLLVYGSQTIGAILWTRRADKKFAESSTGKLKVLMESLLSGPFFLILAYSLSFTNSDYLLIGLFTILLIIGAFLVSGLIAISFAILGEVNPPESRTTIFSLNNLSQTIGRGLGIFIIGLLYIWWDNVYHWGFTIMASLYLLSILFIIPLFRIFPNELAQLRQLLQERANRLTSPEFPE